MKVCYVIESLINSGGMERVLSVCANALGAKLDVFILTLCQNKFDCYFPLDPRIIIYDLGLNDISDKRLLKEQLNSFFLSHCFDIVISLGGIDMYYLATIKDRSKKIIWFHFAYDVSYSGWLGDSPTILDRAKGYFVHLKRIYFAKKFDKVVVLTCADAIAWKRHTKNVAMIYNPITISNQLVSNRKAKRAIAVGRLDYVKGFDYLIEAWHYVSKKYEDWSLDIYGDGYMRDQLQELIDNYNLTESVTLCGRKANIADIYSHYSFFIMSSRSEALGLVLLEASSCGLPLIAFDCANGPREIIKNGENGYLIPSVGDVKSLAIAIIQLIENQDIRDRMGEKALQMAIEKFSLHTICQQWIDLFHQLTPQRNETSNCHIYNSI